MMEAKQMSHLVLEDVTVAFGRGRERVIALDGFSLSLEPGELVVLLGPSGCGKSTILNSVAGLIEPAQGRITSGDHVLFSSAEGVHLPSNRRHLGMVFQSYSLWPHMTVAQNVAFPLKARRTPKAERATRVDEALRRVHVSELAHRYPGELSGGQQQRVAVARAIVAENEVILFDEPLSNLDTKLRLELRDEIRALHQRLGFTGLYVTHDQIEALSLATRVVVMRAGRIEQIGAPEDVYRSPASAYVAGFFGANQVRGDVVDGPSGPVVRGPFGDLPVPSGTPTGPAVACFYPQQARPRAEAGGPAEVVLAKFVGTHREYVVAAGDEQLNLLAPAGEALGVGERVRVDVDPDAVHVYPELDAPAPPAPVGAAPSPVAAP
jgi:iron(III) transport system ATP-binding protein